MHRHRRTQPDDGVALLPTLGTVLAAAGFVLLAVQVIRTLTGGVLGTIGLVLLWVGVGALAVGLLLLVLVVAGFDAADRGASTRRARRGREPGGSEPAVPTSTASAPSTAAAAAPAPVTEPLPPAPPVGTAPAVETAAASDYAQPAGSATFSADDSAEESGHA